VSHVIVSSKNKQSHDFSLEYASFISSRSFAGIIRSRRYALNSLLECVIRMILLPIRINPEESIFFNVWGHFDFERREHEKIFISGMSLRFHQHQFWINSLHHVQIWKGLLGRCPRISLSGVCPARANQPASRPIRGRSSGLTNAATHAHSIGGPHQKDSSARRRSSCRLVGAAPGDVDGVDPPALNEGTPGGTQAVALPVTVTPRGLAAAG